jgi:hypothetical protein
MKTSIGVIAVLALHASLANAAPTTYLFDTVTAVKMDATRPSITGVLHNTTDPVTIAFTDQTNAAYQYVVNRCVPIFLTMIDKPGRYSLELTVDPAQSNVQLISCSLQVRS